MDKKHQYNFSKRNKVKERDYAKDKHELLSEDQAHIDSIRQEIRENKEYWREWLGWACY